VLPEVTRQLGGVLAVNDEPKAEQPMPLERLSKPPVTSQPNGHLRWNPGAQNFRRAVVAVGTGASHHGSVSVYPPTTPSGIFLT
jgi:hypothetical protein